MDIPLELTGPDIENNARVRLMHDEYCEIIANDGGTRRAKWDKYGKTFFYIGTQYVQPVSEDEIAEWIPGSVKY